MQVISDEIDQGGDRVEKEAEHSVYFFKGKGNLKQKRKYFLCSDLIQGVSLYFYFCHSVR